MLPEYLVAKLNSGMLMIEDEQLNENTVIARFAARINAIGALSQAAPHVQQRVLDEVKMVARRVDMRGEAGSADGYARRVMAEVRDRWSLAAIILRPGQHTEPHDHGGWGCVVTVQGVERNRHFTHDDSGRLKLHGERDYPPGTGYIFDPSATHQPAGADPHRVTAALHFLVHHSHAEGA